MSTEIHYYPIVIPLKQVMQYTDTMRDWLAQNIGPVGDKWIVIDAINNSQGIVIGFYDEDMREWFRYTWCL